MATVDCGDLTSVKSHSVTKLALDLAQMFALGCRDRVPATARCGRPQHPAESGEGDRALALLWLVYFPGKVRHHGWCVTQFEAVVSPQITCRPYGVIGAGGRR